MEIAIFLVPTILFLVIVAPIWITMHYSSKRKSQQGLNDSESAELDHLRSVVDLMRDRISTLETILDVETPQWRGKRGEEEYGRAEDDAA